MFRMLFVSSLPSLKDTSKYGHSKYTRMFYIFPHLRAQWGDANQKYVEVLSHSS